MPYGKLINANGNTARYVRLYSNGTSQHKFNRYVEVEVYGTTIDAEPSQSEAKKISPLILLAWCLRFSLSNCFVSLYSEEHIPGFNRYTSEIRLKRATCPAGKRKNQLSVFTIERGTYSGKIRQFVSLDLRFCIKPVDTYVFFYTKGMCLIIKEKGTVARDMN